MLMMVLDTHNVSIVTLKDADYSCMILDVSKSDAIHSLENLGLMIMDLWIYAKIISKKQIIKTKSITLIFII